MCVCVRMLLALCCLWQVRTRSEAHDELANLRRKGEEKALVLSGGSLEVSDGPSTSSHLGPQMCLVRVTLPCHASCSSTPQVCLTHYRAEFIKLARECPAVVCCRCSPTHKAQIVNLIKTYTKRPTCAVGKTWALQFAYSLQRWLPMIAFMFTAE